MDVVLLALRLLLALLLYGFLAALFVMLWRDIRKNSIDRQGLHLGGRLVVLETTDGSVPEGTAFPVLSVTSIGRGPGNTVLIPDTYASAQHALLTWREGQWWLEDLGSRNGTQLNDELVDAPTVVVT
ncbi:MAG: FHA domain-containing protein, partial [Anaerolineales bacterium]|nr:FHA domain-containing protein [Anaerolineales bacterium]